MASDEAYSAFLDQADQDTGAREASSRSSTTTTEATNTDVPPSLQNVDRYYTSDADEPFEPVSLKWEERNMPSENEIKDLVGHSSDVSTLNAQEFDPQGQYKDVLRAVEEAGDGKARIFRLDHGRTRAEYYLISLDTRGQKIVGFKAKAVES